MWKDLTPSVLPPSVSTLSRPHEDSNSCPGQMLGALTKELPSWLHKSESLHSSLQFRFGTALG